MSDQVSFIAALINTFHLHVTMDPNQNAKFPLHEAAREGRSESILDVDSSPFTDHFESANR